MWLSKNKETTVSELLSLSGGEEEGEGLGKTVNLARRNANFLLCFIDLPCNCRACLPLLNRATIERQKCVFRCAFSLSFLLPKVGLKRGLMNDVGEQE